MSVSVSVPVPVSGPARGEEATQREEAAAPMAAVASCRCQLRIRQPVRLSDSTSMQAQIWGAAW